MALKQPICGVVAEGPFRKIMLEAGMSRWKAWKAYWAVRGFGWWAWNKHMLANLQAGERVI